METLQYAKQYLEKGYSVIPLQQRDKKAAISWKQYQETAATLQELESWFGNGSGYNIGIVTGALSGLTVLVKKNAMK